MGKVFLLSTWHSCSRSPSAGSACFFPSGASTAALSAHAVLATRSSLWNLVKFVLRRWQRRLVTTASLTGSPSSDSNTAISSAFASWRRISAVHDDDISDAVRWRVRQMRGVHS